jgi:hypothetical protein
MRLENLLMTLRYAHFAEEAVQRAAAYVVTHLTWELKQRSSPPALSFNADTCAHLCLVERDRQS